MIKRLAVTALAAMVTMAVGGRAMADGLQSKYTPATEPFANFQIKAGLTGLLWQDKNDGVALNGAGIAGADAHAGQAWLPTATLTYYFNKNISAELFCCFARPSVYGDGTLRSTYAQDKIATTWAFPPILTLQYHFEKVGAIRPYVGAGVEYITYFNSQSNMKGALAGFSNVKFGDSWGPVLQAGFDYELGRGWSLGFDAKYVWESTKITWTDPTTNDRITTKHDLNPLLLTFNLGYRFNLEDALGRRAAYEPLK